MSLSINLPSISIGTDAYENIEKYCLPYGTKAVVIGGKKALSAAQAAIEEAVKDSKITITDVLWYGGNATYTNVDRLREEEAVQNADIIFGVGGGRAVDTTKTLSHKIDKPVFTFPTLASNCAPVTEVCVMYQDSGEMDGLYFSDGPTHSFIHSQVIAEAPTKYLWAGIGDALSKQIESDFSARNRELKYKDFLGVTVASRTNTSLINYGEKAMESANNNLVSNALERTALEIILTTGLTSVLVDNDYNSNLAHAFYYGTTAVPAGEKHEHGVLVCYGVLVLLTLDQQYKERDTLYGFMKRINLPTTLEELSITTEEELSKVLDKAMSMKDLNVVPYKITREAVYQAIQEVESLEEAFSVKQSQ